MEDRGGDVVRDVSVDVKSWCTCGLGKIQLQYIRLDQRNVGPILCSAADLRCEWRIDLNGDHTPGARRKKLRHFSVACADFEPGLIGAHVKRAGDALAPRGI